MKKNDPHCFSVFRDKCSKESYTCTLKQVMEAIISGTWKEEIEEIRALLAAGEKEKAAQKKAKLMYVTYSGIFEGGHKATQLKQYSQYMAADFDDVPPERLEECLLKMKELPYVASSFSTPSGGMKAVLLVDSPAEKHKEAYRQAMKEIEDFIGLKTDKACSDICRGHFVSYSPTGWCREDVTPFHLRTDKEAENTPSATQAATAAPAQAATSTTISAETAAAIAATIAIAAPAAKAKKKPVHRPISPKYAMKLMQEAMTKLNETLQYSLHNRNNYIYRVMRAMNSKGVDKETATMLATTMFDLNDLEIVQTVNSAYTHTEEFGTTWEKEKNLVEQVEEYLTRHFVLRKNVVLGQLEYLRVDEDQRKWRPLTDYEENSVLRELLLRNFRIRANLLHSLLGSDYVPLFDPFEDYLTHLPPWDGTTDYLGQVAACVQTTDAAAFDKDFRKWMVATVAGWTQLETVCNETVLALTGAQGTYKTTFLCNLMPPLLRRYADSITGIPSSDDKDARLQLAQCGMINLEEVDVLTKREQAHFKSMLTKKFTNERAFYARNREILPRRAAFTASTNREELLNDPTGTRRWLYHTVLSIVSPYEFCMPYEGMYAQAYALLQSGFKYWYDSDEVRQVNQRNETYRSVSMEEEQLAVCFRCPEEGESYDLLTASQVMERLMAFLRTTMSIVKTGQALRRAGYDYIWRKGIKFYKVKQLDATDIQINKHRTEE